MSSTRRTFLKVLGAGGAAAVVAHPMLRALADPKDGASSDEFFIFIHQAGGWDITLWSDPQAAETKYIDPATDTRVDIATMPLWKAGAAVDGEGKSFTPIKPNASSKLVFGPAIGDLARHWDKLCLFNGVAMSTVSHPDGTYFSSTGRHLAGGRPVVSSIDTVVAAELGLSQLIPSISVGFPTTAIGKDLPQKALPIRIANLGTVTKSITRSTKFETVDDRAAVTAVLSEEAAELSARSWDATPWTAYGLQLDALATILDPDKGFKAMFDPAELAKKYPTFPFSGKPDGVKVQSAAVTNAAFAVEAMSRNVVRSVSFSTSSCDTHNTNYETHGQTLRETFDIVAALLDQLAITPHPTLAGKKLLDHTHILITSDFCRTPGINLAGGRDHYPNNSTLVISPKFKGNTLFGGSDEQLLPKVLTGVFSGEPRQLAPPDILATFLSAQGVDPAPYIRDGEIVKAVLKT
jgi:hypothetical protein